MKFPVATTIHPLEIIGARTRLAEILLSGRTIAHAAALLGLELGSELDPRDAVRDVVQTGGLLPFLVAHTLNMTPEKLHQMQDIYRREGSQPNPRRRQKLDSLYEHLLRLAAQTLYDERTEQSLERVLEAIRNGGSIAEETSLQRVRILIKGTSDLADTVVIRLSPTSPTRKRKETEAFLLFAAQIIREVTAPARGEPSRLYQILNEIGAERAIVQIRLPDAYDYTDSVNLVEITGMVIAKRRLR